VDGEEVVDARATLKTCAATSHVTGVRNHAPHRWDPFVGWDRPVLCRRLVDAPPATITRESEQRCGTAVAMVTLQDFGG
jgi:hypothetical protein